jgi:uncharacterized membrane-anchored protein YhcB (DUF1043 family)
VRKAASTLVLGIAIGALSIALIRRLREVQKNREPDELLDRLSDQLSALEARFGR